MYLKTKDASKEYLTFTKTKYPTTNILQKVYHNQHIFEIQLFHVYLKKAIMQYSLTQMRTNFIFLHYNLL